MCAERSVRRIKLDIFLDCTLGGFAEDYHETFRQRIRRLWDRGVPASQIAEIVGSSRSSVNALACKWAFPYRCPRGRKDRMNHGHH